MAEGNTMLIGNMFGRDFELSAGQSVTINHVAIPVLVLSDRGGVWFEGTSQRTLVEISSTTYISVTRLDAYNLKVTSNAQYGTRIYAISFNNPITFITN